MTRRAIPTTPARPARINTRTTHGTIAGSLIQHGTEMEGAGPDGKPGSGLKWKTKYTVAGLNVPGQTMAVEGMGGKGSAGRLLQFVGHARDRNVHAGQENNPVVSWEMLTGVPGYFATLGEVKKARRESRSTARRPPSSPAGPRGLHVEFRQPLHRQHDVLFSRQ